MKPRWGPGKPLETSGSDPVGGRMRLREKASGQTGQWELTGLWKTLEQNSETERERLRGRERERERESKRQRESERESEQERERARESASERQSEKWSGLSITKRDGIRDSSVERSSLL